MTATLQRKCSGGIIVVIITKMITNIIVPRNYFVLISARMVDVNNSQKAADVCKKDVWDFQAFSQTFFELRFSLGNEGKDGKNLNSQTWPGTPRRPSSRHPQPS